MSEFYNQDEDPWGDLPDQAYDAAVDEAMSEYGKANVIAAMTMEGSDSATHHAIHTLDLAMRARSDASRIWALMDAGEPVNSANFRGAIRAAQLTNRELKGMVATNVW